MKNLVIILLLLPFTGWAQYEISGKVSICKDCRVTRLKNKTENHIPYILKTKRNRKGKLKTETIYAKYELVKSGEPISSGTTKSDGSFEIKDLASGSYKLDITINKFLKTDTVIEISKKRTKIDLEINTEKYWAYIDSTQLAKYPYSKQLAESDIKKGNIKILSFGMPLMSDDKLNEFAIKYGFKYESVAGCVVSYYEAKAIENYNKVVYEYLNLNNEDGWRDKLNSDIRKHIEK